MDRPLSEVGFVAFDLETTGLFPILCRIVEFGALRFRLDGTELSQFEQRAIVMVHEGGTRGTTQRRVTPRGLLQSGGRAYLTAYCHADGIEKTYHLDRIREFWIE